MHGEGSLGEGSLAEGSLAEGALAPGGGETAARSSAAGRWRPSRGLHSSPSLPLALHVPHLPLHLGEGESKERTALRRGEKVAAVPGSWREGSWREGQSPELPPWLSNNASPLHAPSL